MELKAQEYLNKRYPKNERQNVVELNLKSSQVRLVGKLDLSDFVKLERLNCSQNSITDLDLSGSTKLIELDCSDNQLKSLDLSNNMELEKVIIYGNHITVGLSIFSHLAKVKKLFIGSRGGQKGNNFTGSLKDLENCENLEFLNIRGLKRLNGGLKHLPTINLKHFDCDSTVYADILKEFKKNAVYIGDPWDGYSSTKYDVGSWKLINHSDLISSNREDIIVELDKKLEHRDKSRIEAGRLTSFSVGNEYLLLERERTKQLKELILELKNA